MGEVLEKLEEHDIVFFKEFQYTSEKRREYLDIFKDLKKEGKILSAFEEDSWFAFTGVHGKTINFTFDTDAYMLHLHRHLHIKDSIIKDMLKCYAVFLSGTYIFTNIHERIRTLTTFLTRFGDRKYRVPETMMGAIAEFLEFIGTPESDIEDICLRLRLSATKRAGQRKLAPLLNYLAIANEVKDMYSIGLSDEEFIKWFPIYFWTSITFVIPLRATEMLLTPKDCITQKDGKYYIHLRRTMLKKGLRTVYYSVDRDYKEFVYPVPATEVVQTILRYQDMTSNQDRKYLFAHNECALYGMMQLHTMNDLIEDFVSTHLVGNRKYDYARFATGTREFKAVTAGDSRPIAISGLYFQDVSLELCRQLADHEHLDTTYGYASNVSETIYASSVMEIQNKINRERSCLEEMEALKNSAPLAKPDWVDNYGCASLCRPHETGDLTDCFKYDHCDECLGCGHYYPSKEQLDTEMKNRRKKLDEASALAVRCLNDSEKAKKDHIDIDKVFLDTHTNAVRYKEACDTKAREEARKWQRHRNTAMT